MTSRSVAITTAYFVFVAALLFGAARTVDYWQAWLYLALSLLCHIGIVLDLARRDPALLERRRKAGSAAEVRPVQKNVIRALLLLWVVVIATAGFDRRFGWSHMPVWLDWLGAIVFLAAQALMIWVLRSNTYARATIEVSEGQPVSDRGPYRIVRHPMYGAMILAGLSAGLVLDSWWAFALTVLNVPLFALRLLDEERMMEEELPGYPDYMRKVRARLVPGVW
jgi:protein-S-isoprenylcysteine O-methyltransferase Ste14